MTADYQVNLLRKSADRVQKILTQVMRCENGQAHLRLQELALDLRREAHELESHLSSSSISHHSSAIRHHSSAIN